MKIISIDIYKTRVRLLVGDTPKIRSHPIFKTYGYTREPRFFDECDGACIQDLNKEYGPLVWLKSKKNISHVCHEVIHAAFHILGNAGVKVDDENHEALTYLVGFILEEILK